MAYRPARIGPHADRPHFVIARSRLDDPRLFCVTSQNHRSRRLFGRDMANGEAMYLPMDDVLATHDDEDEARKCFDAVQETLPELDLTVYRAQRALEAALKDRAGELRRIAIGAALA